MSFDVYLPFIASVIFGTLGGHVARRLRPARATWLLTCGAVVTSACTTCSLLLLAWALLARLSVVASVGDWSTAVFRQHNPVNIGVSVAAVAVLVVVCTRTCRAMSRHIRELALSYRVCRCLPPSVGELVVVDDPEFHARAVPGRPGRIVVSKAAVTSLPAAERAAVLAHERSHLVHRHHLHRLAVALAAAANPALRALPRAMSLNVERWADEDAARLCAPEAVASALCRAVVNRTATGRTPASRRRLSEVAQRAAALRHAPRGQSPRGRSARGQFLRGRFQRGRSLRGRAPQLGGWIVLPLAAASLAAVVFSSAEATTDARQLARRSDVAAPTVITPPHKLATVTAVRPHRPW